MERQCERALLRKRRRPYPTSALREAIRAVETGRSSIRQAAFKFGVPRSTVRDKVRGLTSVTCKKGPAPFLSEQEEQRLALWTVQMALDGQSCTRDQIQDMAQKIVLEDGRPTPFKDGRPGRQWLMRFLGRNPDVCQVLGDEVKLALPPTQEELDQWFADLYVYLKEQDLVSVFEIPNCIWSVSELCLTLSQKGSRVMTLKRSAPNSEASHRITIFPAVNAAGIACPPMMCFPVCKTKLDEWQPSQPPPDSWKSVRSVTGALNPELFLEWLQEHFHPYLVSSQTRTPVLLFVDGHSTYITEEAGQFCLENGIILYRIPPNSATWLDPMAMCIFRPVYDKFLQRMAEWQNANQDDVLTKDNVCPLFTSVWSELEETPKIVRDGFAFAGLYPLDPRYNRREVMENLDTEEEGQIPKKEDAKNMLHPYKWGRKKAPKTKRPERVPYTHETLIAAIRRCELGELSVRAAAREYGIPSSTLKDKLNGKTALNARKGTPPCMSAQEEKDIATWAVKMIRGGRNVTTAQLAEMAQKIVLSDGRRTPFKNGKPGQSWWRSFLNRNPEVLQAQQLHIDKCKVGITPEDIDTWFENLRMFLEEEKMLSILEVPDRMWTASEFTFPLSSRAGEFDVMLKRSSKMSRKRFLTTFHAFSASGLVCPPMVCYPARRPPVTWKPLVGVPESWSWAIAQDGMLNSDVLLHWLRDHFYPFLKASGTHFPVLLLIPGFGNHEVSDEASDFCNQNKIVLNRYPANSACVLDPVELTIKEPLAGKFKAEVKAWKEFHPDEQLTKEHFAGVFYSAFAEIETQKDLLQKGFYDAGLFPFDGTFSREKLLASFKPEHSVTVNQRQGLATSESTPVTNNQANGAEVTSDDDEEQIEECPPSPAAYQDTELQPLPPTAVPVPVHITKADLEAPCSSSTSKQIENGLRKTPPRSKKTRVAKRSEKLQIKLPSGAERKRKIKEAAKLSELSRFLAKKRKEREPTDDMQRARRDVADASQALQHAQRAVGEALKFVKEARANSKSLDTLEKEAREELREATRKSRMASTEARQARIELREAENMQKTAWKEAREARKTLRIMEEALAEAKSLEFGSRNAPKTSVKYLIDEEICARCECRQQDEEDDREWVSCSTCARRLHLVCTNMFHLSAAQIEQINYSCPWCSYGYPQE